MDIDGKNLMAVLNLLAERPTCEHGLNGPCGECGPGLSLDDTIRWKAEMAALDIEREGL